MPTCTVENSQPAHGPRSCISHVYVNVHLAVEDVMLLWRHGDNWLRKSQYFSIHSLPADSLITSLGHVTFAYVRYSRSPDRPVISQFLSIRVALASSVDHTFSLHNSTIMPSPSDGRSVRYRRIGRIVSADLAGSMMSDAMFVSDLSVISHTPLKRTIYSVAYALIAAGNISSL